jgi:hypothetical protein
MIDRDSNLGQSYETNKQNNPLYRYAHFYSVNEVAELLQRSGFSITKIFQTIFYPADEIKTFEKVNQGYGKRGFVVIGANAIKN